MTKDAESEFVASLTPDDRALFDRLSVALDNMLEDGDFASHVLPTLDFEAQQLAIVAMLARNARAAEDLSEEIDDLAARTKEARGEYADHVVGVWADRMHDYTYADAANSMSALGMIAPFIESVFSQAYIGIGAALLKVGRDRPGERRKLAADHEEFWNCHKYWSRDGEKRDDVALGILQLADAIELTALLPKDFPPRLKALMNYRNFMFHNGFEWPVERRASFQAMIEKEGWGAYFSKAESNDEPWIFYMSDDFISGWKAGFDEVRDAIGKYVRERRDLFRT